VAKWLESLPARLDYHRNLDEICSPVPFSGPNQKLKSKQEAKITVQKST